MLGLCAGRGKRRRVSFGWCVEIGRAHFLVMLGGKMFGEIVGKVFMSGSPVDAKLSLVDTIADPVEAHIDRFGATLLDCVIDDTGGA